MTVRTGSKSAEEVLLAVGNALSWWEGAEDLLSALFMNLVGSEGASTDAFIRAGARRSDRTRMLKKAMAEQESVFDEKTHGELNDAIDQLNALSSTRNQIAHGHCSSLNLQIEGQTTLSGFFLRSAMSPDGHFITPDASPMGLFERPPRYLFAAKDIDQFTTDVRKYRGVVMDAVFHLIGLKIDADSQSRAAP